MSIKESLKNVAARIGQQAGDIRGQNVPKWGQMYEEIGRYGNERINPYIDKFQGMVEDESKRGYSPETVNLMRGRATGSVAGAMRSAAEDTGRQIAAAGMGRTGMGINAAKQRGYQRGSLMREANRDIDIADAEAKRQDLWNASQAWQQGINMGQNLFNTRMNAAQGENQAMRSVAEIEGMQVPPLMGAHDTSFWGNMTDYMPLLQSAMGSGIPWSKIF